MMVRWFVLHEMGSKAEFSLQQGMSGLDIWLYEPGSNLLKLLWDRQITTDYSGMPVEHVNSYRSIM